MKIKYIKKILLLLLLLVINIVSCEDTDANHREYLEEGETLYTTKPTLVDVFVGHNRVQLKPELKNAFAVKDIIVFWNEETESQVFPYTKSSNDIDFPELIISDLEEKTYKMDLYTRDNEGNRSLKITSFVTAYGEEYRLSLVSRPIKAFVFNGVNGEIFWSPSDNLERGSNLEFMDTSGELISVDIPENEEVTLLENLDIDFPVTYNSFFVPLEFDDENQRERSIDVFPSDTKTIGVSSELKTILASLSITPIGDGIQLNWTNDTNSSVNVNVDYTVSGVSKNSTLENTNTVDGDFVVRGLEPGIQDVTITISNSSGSGFGNIFSVNPLPIVPFDSTTLSIVNLPTDLVGDSFGGSVDKIIDGIVAVGNWYHTDSGSGVDLLQHHVTVDLKEQAVLTKFRVDPRQVCCQARNPSRFQLWGRADLSGDAETTLLTGDPGWEDESISKGWILLLDESPDSSWNGSAAPWEAYIPPNIPVQFVRFRFISNFNGDSNTALSEFTFWK